MYAVVSISIGSCPVCAQTVFAVTRTEDVVTSWDGTDKLWCESTLKSAEISHACGGVEDLRKRVDRLRNKWAGNLPVLVEGDCWSELLEDITDLLEGEGNS